MKLDAQEIEPLDVNVNQSNYSRSADFDFELTSDFYLSDLASLPHSLDLTFGENLNLHENHESNHESLTNYLTLDSGGGGAETLPGKPLLNLLK